MSARRDIHQEVTDRIVKALEAGTVPWVQPWNAAKGGSITRPCNAITGRCYNGINVFLLWLTAAERGYTDGRWMTFNQAKKAGGFVRKGERSTTVTFWKQLEIEDVDDDTGEVTRKRIPLLRTFNLFNVAQIEGLDFDEPAIQAEPLEGQRPNVDAWIEATGAGITYGSDRAYYDRQADRITVPSLDQYDEAGPYYSTVFHELTHWTGAPERLDREKGKVFGDKVYAAEELVAEMGSAFLCADHNIKGGLQHPEYLGYWVEHLKADKKAIFHAASLAGKAAEYLHGQTGLEEEVAEAA